MTTPQKPVSQASSSGSSSSSSASGTKPAKGSGGLHEQLEAVLATMAMTEEVHDNVERYLARMPTDPALAEREFYAAMPREDIDPETQKKLDAVFGHPHDEKAEKQASPVG